MNWHEKIEAFLAPAQGLTKVILVGVIILSAWMIFQKSNTLRTAYTAWVIFP